MTGMDITVHASFLPHDDPEASLAFYHDVLGFEVRSDVGQGTMRWITVGPPNRPDTSILLAPPAADPGITDDERRTIAEMMAKGTYGWILLAHQRPRRHLRANPGARRRGRPGADRPAVRGSRLRRPRSGGQPDPHPGAALSRPAIAPAVTRLGLVRRTEEVLRDG
jgi:catechol 2,3-dioxygenase-like lactoylglutathione lyase family enzyme